MRDLLVRIWKLVDRPCGQFLRPVLGVRIDCLRKDGTDIPEEMAEALPFAVAGVNSDNGLTLR